MSVVVSLKYEVGGPQGMTPVELKLALERLGGAVPRIMRHMGPHLSRALEKNLRTRFSVQGAGGPESGVWSPLSARYARWKRRHYPGRKILTLTGAVRNALTKEADSKAERTFGDSLMAFGTRGIEYASYHQTGTRKMPARPPFDFGGAQFDSDWKKAIQLGFISATRAARAEALFP